MDVCLTVRNFNPLFANSWALHLEISPNTFRVHLSYTEQTKKIEASIWKQIDNGNENDYIHFHLRRADESYLPVLDHGRIVESQQYGKVFYVLFMDWEDMNSYYSEKFSR